MVENDLIAHNLHDFGSDIAILILILALIGMLFQLKSFASYMY